MCLFQLSLASFCILYLAPFFPLINFPFLFTFPFIFFFENSRTPFQAGCDGRRLNLGYNLSQFSLCLSFVVFDDLYFINLVFSARCNIYIWRLSYDASVCLSVCLWRLCTVVTGCDGSRISLHALIDGCLYYLLTTPDPDGRMGWCRDFWWKRGVWKKRYCSDIAYFTYFLLMDHNHVTYLFIWTI